MINISEEDINYAAEILLKNGRYFDEERTDFIRNLSTIDLQAVPGSGKTTALLAKLLILEKKLPLLDNKGILVISHTNAAVDEIKDRIGHLCPKLFSHPNFVGTIQSFVDTFLAIPAYLLKYKQKPVRIDNDAYNETILKFFNYGKEGFSRQEKNNAIYYNNVFNVLYNYRFQKSKSGYVMVHKMNGKLLEVKTPNPRKVKFTPFEIKRITEWLKITKEKTFETGMLCYDDAYFLADVLLDEIKDYDRLIQQRFQYVFVDEMQDMELHQISLIEKLFTGHSCTSKLQRLGDLNQCIFSGDINTEKIWNQRLDKLFFNGSHRLSPRVASIVQNLSSVPTGVEGRGNNDDDSVIDIKPKMYVFDVTEAHQVIPRFSKMISEYQERGYLPISTQNYHAFGWRKETDKDHKLCLNTYLPSLKSNTSKSKIEFETLEDYLLFLPKRDGSLKTCRSAILSCLTKVLRLENLKDEHNRYMTPYRLIHTIKKIHLSEYDGFKNKIYNWSINLAESNINDTLAEIRDFIPNLLSWFGSEINNSNTFITTSSVHKEEEGLNEFKNYYDGDGFQIKVGTVHNIKGQTHTASLYLETFWNGKYESERVKDQFFGVPIDVSSKGLTVAATAKLNQTLKMMYVGFSRPTHLLAFAVEKSRFDKNLKEIDRNIWDVIEIKKNDKAEDS